MTAKGNYRNILAKFHIINKDSRKNKNSKEGKVHVIKFLFEFLQVGWKNVNEFFMKIFVDQKEETWNES